MVISNLNMHKDDRTLSLFDNILQYVRKGLTVIWVLMKVKSNKKVLKIDFTCPS